MTFASRTQFHIERPWGQRLFQPGEGPSRGLLRAYKPSDGTFSSTSGRGDLEPRPEAVQAVPREVRAEVLPPHRGPQRVRLLQRQV